MNELFGLVLLPITHDDLTKKLTTMSRLMNFNISLTPITTFDLETKTYVTYYKEFPNAIAVGNTEEEAETNLDPLVELMWKEKPLDLEKRLMEIYLSNRNRNTPTISNPSPNK